MTANSTHADADSALLAMNGVRSVTAQDGIVVVEIDTATYVTDLLGTLAIAITEDGAGITDRLNELAWLYQRMCGLSDGSLDPKVEEVDQPTAMDLLMVALVELLVASGLDTDMTLRLPLAGLVAPVLAEKIDQATPEVVHNVRAQINLGRVNGAPDA